MDNFGFGSANELAAQLGIAVLLFFSLVALALIMLKNMKTEALKWEQREKNTTAVYQSIISEISKTRDKDFDLLKGALDDNRDQISILRGVVERLKAMQHESNNHRNTSEQAFRDLFTKVSVILENRCINHLKHPAEK
ncbi:MAG: hypothetical protein WCK32_00820 [Chlorobiaceae bacterium]